VAEIAAHGGEDEHHNGRLPHLVGELGRGQGGLGAYRGAKCHFRHPGTTS
jgi:hypothetical protein